MRGWHRESVRHALAARGIKTTCEEDCWHYDPRSDDCPGLRFKLMPNDRYDKEGCKACPAFRACGIRTCPSLKILMKESLKYPTFEQFERAYSMENMHGMYWHLTNDPNFKIDQSYSPRDMSSMAGGDDGIYGLMVSTDIDNWHASLPGRKYAARIDLSDAVPGKDFVDTTRGFGHEIFINNPSVVRVIEVIPIRNAIKKSDYYYDHVLPQSKEELKEVYDAAR